MTKTMKKRIQKFTIVEILVAMSVFAILMLIIMQIFGSLQSVWTTTSKRTQTAQNANVIMNMLAADFQSAYYNMDADENSSWCYYQNGTDLTGDTTPVWFITSRQKSAQSANSAQVLTGYWVESVTKDGVNLLALKNLPLSNVDYEIEGSSLKTSELCNYRTEKNPPSSLKEISSDLKKISVLLDDNIVSLKITPYVKIINPSTGAATYNNSGSCEKLPAYVEIKLEMLDDDPAVREAYKDASSEDQKKMIRTYTRIIEINRGQYYEQSGGAV